MKNKDKFVKIANIISKVLIGIMIALLLLCVGVVCFRACSADKQVAYASETDGIGTWVWNDTVNIPPIEKEYQFDFVSADTNFYAIGIYSDNDVISYLEYNAPALNVYEHGFGGWDTVNILYKTIDIKTAPSAEFLTILQANATYQGGTTPTTYTVTKQAIDCSIIGADTVEVGQSYSYQIAPNTGYNYPDTVSVLGADYTYDKSTGKISISDITGNVTINVRALAKTFNVSFNVSNATVSGPTFVESGGPYVYHITPNAGYTYPDTVNVVGATVQDYSNTTGRLELISPSADVTISGVSALIVGDNNSIRGRYVFKNQIELSSGTWTGQVVDFSVTLSNGESADFVRLRAAPITNGFALYFGRTLNGTVSDTLAYSSVPGSNTDVGWTSPIYQSIDFGDSLQSVSAEFYTWLMANTVPSGVNADSYNIGYNAGLEVGQNIGYTNGYSAGDLAGYNRGYEAGLADGSSGAIHGSEDIIAGTASLFAIKIFGTFSMLDCFLVIFGIGVCIWFLKMFAGG